MSTLWLEFWTEEQDFCIYAEADDYEKELTLTGQAKTIITHFDTIYAILQELKTRKADDLTAALHFLSERLLAPLHHAVTEVQPRPLYCL